jgi:hypothetical protein
MSRALYVLCLFCATGLIADLIPEDRRITWTGRSGIPGGIPTNQTIWASDVTVSIPGSASVCVGDGITDNATAFDEIRTRCPAGQVVKFPAGRFRSTADLSSGNKPIVFRGAGMGLTIFTNCALFMGQNSQLDFTNVVLAGSTRGSTNIYVDTTNGFGVGKKMIIEGGDDATIINRVGYETTALAPAQWQIVEIVEIGTQRIKFWPGLYWDVDTNSSVLPSAKIYHGTGSSPTNFVQWGGFEDFTISIRGSSESACQMSTIAYCWLKNIEFDQPKNHCIYWRRAYRCEITGCFLHDSTVNGSGGGYGVTFENGCTANLVYDNIVSNHTGAFQVNEGSSGNVFAFNYIPASDYNNPQYNQPDFQNHSAHPLMNLWESNWGYMALFDDIHGSSSHHTIYRNRLQGYQNATITHQQYCIGIETFTTYVNAIGNVLGDSHMNLYRMDQGTNFADTSFAIYAIGYDQDGRGDTSASDTVLIHMNQDSETSTNGGVVWGPNADRTLPDSFYLSSKPDWMGFLRFPAYSPLNPFTSEYTSPTNIPAGYRSAFGTNPAAASALQSITSVAGPGRTRARAMRP